MTPRVPTKTHASGGRVAGKLPTIRPIPHNLFTPPIPQDAHKRNETHVSAYLHVQSRMQRALDDLPSLQCGCVRVPVPPQTELAVQNAHHWLQRTRKSHPHSLQRESCTNPEQGTGW